MSYNTKSLCWPVHIIAAGRDVLRGRSFEIWDFIWLVVGQPPTHGTTGTISRFRMCEATLAEPTFTIPGRHQAVVTGKVQSRAGRWHNACWALGQVNEWNSPGGGLVSRVLSSYCPSVWVCVCVCVSVVSFVVCDALRLCFFFLSFRSVTISSFKLDGSATAIGECKSY